MNDLEKAKIDLAAGLYTHIDLAVNALNKIYYEETKRRFMPFSEKTISQFVDEFRDITHLVGKEGCAERLYKKIGDDNVKRAARVNNHQKTYHNNYTWFKLCKRISMDLEAAFNSRVSDGKKVTVRFFPISHTASHLSPKEYLVDLPDGDQVFYWLPERKYLDYWHKDKGGPDPKFTVETDVISDTEQQVRVFHSHRSSRSQVLQTITICLVKDGNLVLARSQSNYYYEEEDLFGSIEEAWRNSMNTFKKA